MMRITILGHAGLVIESDGANLLVDPLLRDDLAGGSIVFHPGRELDATALPDITHLVLSHGHLDHFDPASLASLPRSIPVLIPADPWLHGEVGALGFDDIIALKPWDRYTAGPITIMATPSAFEIDEMGMVFVDADGSSFWHVSDSIIGPDDGRRVRSEVGALTVSSTKFQPGRVLVSHQRNLGAWIIDKQELADGLEAVIAASPQLVFPSAWGVAYGAGHEWANRYSAPFLSHEMVRLLERRVDSSTSVEELVPGDVIAIHAGTFRVERQGSPFVRHAPTAVEEWEPVDVTTLVGVADETERVELVTRLERYLVDTFGPWLAALTAEEAPLRKLVDWGIVWQLIVHAGERDRLLYSLDFREPDVRLRRKRHPDANYFVHMGGADLLGILRNAVGSELLWLCGGARTYEKVLIVNPEGISEPPAKGWHFYEHLPEPLSLCLRKQGVPTP